MNFFDQLQDASQEEIFEEVFKRGGVRVERITSMGQSSPEGFWYNQDENEWVMLLQGEARLELESGEEVSLKAGDHYYLPAKKKHRVSYTSTEPSCLWLAVFWSVNTLSS